MPDHVHHGGVVDVGCVLGAMQWWYAAALARAAPRSEQHLCERHDDGYAHLQYGALRC